MIGVTPSPPAFSMGSVSRFQTTRKDRDSTHLGPGGIHLKNKGPEFTLGVKSALKPPDAIPGAGTYEVPSKMIESPGKSILKKYSLKQENLGDGPGAYNPHR